MIVNTKFKENEGVYKTICAINAGALIVVDQGRFVYAPLSGVKFSWDPAPPKDKGVEQLIPLGIAARNLKEGEIINYISNGNTTDILTNGAGLDQTGQNWSWSIETNNGPT